MEPYVLSPQPQTKILIPRLATTQTSFVSGLERKVICVSLSEYFDSNKTLKERELYCNRHGLTPYRPPTRNSLSNVGIIRVVMQRE